MREITIRVKGLMIGRTGHEQLAKDITRHTQQFLEENKICYSKIKVILRM